MADAGRRLIAALKEAIEGDFARVTINGVTWVRRDAPEPPPEAFAQARLEAWNEAVEACAQWLRNEAPLPQFAAEGLADNLCCALKRASP